MIKEIISDPFVLIIYLFTLIASFMIGAFVIKGNWVVMAFIAGAYLWIRNKL